MVWYILKILQDLSVFADWGYALKSWFIFFLLKQGNKTIIEPWELNFSETKLKKIGLTIIE